MNIKKFTVVMVCCVILFYLLISCRDSLKFEPADTYIEAYNALEK